MAPFKHPDPPSNMREVVITTFPYIDVSKSFLQEEPKSFIEQVHEFIDVVINMTNLVLTDPAVVDFMHKREKFDVIIQEIFLAEALLGFGKHFNAPIIGFSTFGASKWSTDLNGSPSPPSYVPNVQLSFSDRMTFVERLINVVVTAVEGVYFGHYFHGKQV